MTARFPTGCQKFVGGRPSPKGKALPAPANDNPYIRLTLRHDRATVVAIDSPEFGKRLSRLFAGTDSAAAIEYAHEIAEVLGTRVQAIVIDGARESSGSLPVLTTHHQERAS